MGWEGDSLVIRFCNSKTDQKGEKKRDPRHIYPNSLMPEICPILGLALFWICFPFDTAKEKGKLFEGNDQYERFSKIMGKQWDSPEVSEQLLTLGLEKRDLGTHSFRKGAATYIKMTNANRLQAYTT